MVSVENALRLASRLLVDGGIDAPRHEARILLGHVTGKSREALLVDHQQDVGAPAIDELTNLARRRANHEPMAYLIGEREFWGLAFEVTRDTLIPRPDSETLVEAALEFARQKSDSALRILDLGAGSGCLLVSLLHELPDSKGIGVDQNRAALEVAARNAARHGLSARAQFIASSWGADLSPSFDVILANPPYIADCERTTLMPEVALYEPPEALFAGERGEDAFLAMAPEVARLLAPKGRAFIEFGAGQGGRTAEILRAVGLFECERRKDLAGIERCGVFEFLRD
jgi:release factor glutamine methyltransferase